MIFTNRLNISRYLFGEEDHPKSWLLIFKFQFISMWRKGPYMTFHLGTGPAFVVRLRCIIKARQVLICQVSGRISDMSGWLQRLTQFNPEGPSSWPKGLGTWGTCVASQNLYVMHPHWRRGAPEFFCGHSKTVRGSNEILKKCTDAVDVYLKKFQVFNLLIFGGAGKTHEATCNMVQLQLNFMGINWQESLDECWQLRLALWPCW